MVTKIDDRFIILLLQAKRILPESSARFYWGNYVFFRRRLLLEVGLRTAGPERTASLRALGRKKVFYWHVDEFDDIEIRRGNIWSLTSNLQLGPSDGSRNRIAATCID